METSEKINQLSIQIQSKLNEVLASLVQQPVNLHIDHSGLIPITQSQQLLKNYAGQVTTIYIPVTGEVTGDIFVFLPQELSTRIADLLIGNEPGTTKIISDFEGSALKEFGNITFGVIVTEVANLLKFSMMLTVPNLATDMASALIDQVLIEYGENATEMLAIQMQFTIGENSQGGSFLVLFDKASSDLINSKIQQA